VSFDGTEVIGYRVNGLMPALARLASDSNIKSEIFSHPPPNPKTTPPDWHASMQAMQT